MAEKYDEGVTVLVTGGGGQLGCELADCNEVGVRVVALTRSELDITDPAACEREIGCRKPDAVIHAAAYTAVDAAETDRDGAWRVNAEGTRSVAAAAEKINAKFCYISTDYVFDGSSTVPYREDSPTGPLTVYGQTKLAGERVAAACNSRLFIVRTSWVYGRYGRHFVHAMLEQGHRSKRLKVVDDQTGSPTYARDLAQFLLALVQTDKYGVYHACNGGSCNWYEFARAIFAERPDLSVSVVPCPTSEFPRPAPRPAYSVLGGSRLAEAGFRPLRPWREALQEYLRQSDEYSDG